MWRQVRAIIRDIEWTEKYGLPALYYPSKEVDFLNKLMFQMVKEIRLPLEPPSVAPFSTKYYYTAPVVNVVFVPLSEPDFLTHLPDLYHELGHYVSLSMHGEDSDGRLNPLAANYQSAFSAITAHYNNLLTQKIRTSELEDIVYLIRRIFGNWKNWIEEFFGDIFAVGVLGPAYAWSHLHLSTKLSENIFRLSKVLEESHPSNESRMRILNKTLTMLGFESEARSISRKWSEIMGIGKPKPEYQYAYPDFLLENLARCVIQGMKDCGIIVSSPELLLSKEGADIRVIMNSAWNNYWELDPKDYREWEKQSLSELRKKLHAV